MGGYESVSKNQKRKQERKHTFCLLATIEVRSEVKRRERRGKKEEEVVFESISHHPAMLQTSKFNRRIQTPSMRAPRIRA